jgi:hypothetical protein
MKPANIYRPDTLYIEDIMKKATRKQVRRLTGEVGKKRRKFSCKPQFTELTEQPQ